ncbi:UNVERIFIED_CONTAM: hypothetical protein HDU68_001379 [Siphonaria sp. JEL0065]|nr:hypothetical protein HDU68_001379 [Siphonaria sp. JEL0065]
MKRVLPQLVKQSKPLPATPTHLDQLLLLGRKGRLDEMAAEFWKLPDKQKDVNCITAVLRVMTAKSNVDKPANFDLFKGRKPASYSLKICNANPLSQIANGFVAEWQTLNEDKVPDVLMLRALMRVHAKHSAVRPLLETLRLLIRHYPSSQPDVEALSIVVFACANRLRKPHIRLMNKSFEAYVEKKLSSNRRIDARVLGNLCYGYSRAGNIDKLVQVFGSMESRYSVEPTNVIYTIVINSFGSAGKLDDMMVWMAKMRKAGVEMDHVVYNAVITCFGKAGDLDRMEQMYHVLMEGLLNGSIPQFPKSVAGSKRKRSERELLGVTLNQQISDSLRKQLRITFTSLVEGFARGGEFGKVAWVHLEMKKHGIASDDIGILKRNRIKEL